MTLTNKNQGRKADAFYIGCVLWRYYRAKDSGLKELTALDKHGREIGRLIVSRYDPIVWVLDGLQFNDIDFMKTFRMVSSNPSSRENGFIGGDFIAPCETSYC